MLYEIFVKAISLSKEVQKNYLVEIKQAHPELFDELLAMIKDDETSKSMDTQYWSSLMANESSGIINSAQDLSGLIISPFKLTELIDKGGMGSVYKAQRCDDQFEQTVAIKIIHSELENIIGEQALIREAGFMAKLTHPNISKVYDAGISDDGHHFIVMEYINGCTITEKFKEPTLTLNEKLKIFCDLCDAVNHAHQMQVIHADLKPANILITQDNQVKILDFGIARMFNSRSNDSSSAYTSYLNAMTASFASPELLAGDKPNMYSDIFALGKVFLNLFDGSMHNKTKYQRELVSIGNKASASNSAERYSSIAELRKDIEDYISGYAVSAFKSNKWYQFNKLVFKRHPVASFHVISIIVFVSFLLVKMSIQNKNLTEANKQSTSLVSKFSEIFEMADPRKTDGESFTAINLLDGATSMLAKDTSLTKLSKIKMELVLAKSYKNLGSKEVAKKMLLELLTKVTSFGDTNLIYQVAHQLAVFRYEETQLNFAEPLLSPLADVFDKRQPNNLTEVNFLKAYLSSVNMRTNAGFNSKIGRRILDLEYYAKKHFFESMTQLQQAKLLRNIASTTYRTLPAGLVNLFFQIDDAKYESSYIPKLNEALSNLNSANALNEGIDSEIFQADILRLLALVNNALGNSITAESQIGEAIDIYNNKLGLEHPDQLNVHYNAYIVYYHNKPKKTLESILKIQSLTNKDDQFNYYYVNSLIFEIYLRLGQTDNYIAHFNKVAEDYLSEELPTENAYLLYVITTEIYKFINATESLPKDIRNIVSRIQADYDFINKKSGQDPFKSEAISDEFLSIIKNINLSKFIPSEIPKLITLYREKNASKRRPDMIFKLKKGQLLKAKYLLMQNKPEDAKIIMAAFEEFTWNSREKNISIDRLDILLLQADIYLRLANENINELSVARDFIDAAKTLYSNLPLEKNNAWKVKLEILKAKYLIANSEFKQAKITLANLKTLVEQFYMDNSLLKQEYNELLVKVKANF